MLINVETTKLMKYLKTKNEVYHSKILELRSMISKWLNYIPTTFPHYTSHSIEHSEEIILQLSKLLFADDSSIPEVNLSAIETYILLASAYLHDAGMVVSDAEKRDILSSDEWRDWIIGEGGGAKRWQQIEKFRLGNSCEIITRDFIADRQARFLIAEFIRKYHHLRVAKVIQQHQATLGRFAFDDVMLQKAISDVCVAHGLEQYQLEDKDKYPDRRDIQGDPVNLRFLAVLLRIGDLLDMHNDRACPLLYSAASPFPGDSLAHWTKYQRITHKMTAPDEIQITAECHNQQEHRFLQDWCNWLVSEIKNADSLISRCARHSNWKPPTIELSQPNKGGTINIFPAQDANYIPMDWKFEIDSETVLRRLISDIYSHPYAFVKELIQNSLDAMRCQLYNDLERQGQPLSDKPTSIPSQIRANYALKICLTTEDVTNELSGERETKQVLIIDDCGIGMDREVINRYFLQIGKSFYSTEDFRNSYRFIPTSRFGIGFLSVFSASDLVVIDTYKPKSPKKDQPIRLTLTGPRNYILVEKSSRSSSGTKIKIYLKEEIPPEQFERSVTAWCRMVEFPIELATVIGFKTITAERSEDFIWEARDITEKSSFFKVKMFPINRSGLEGEILLLAYQSGKGESWAEGHYAKYNYHQKHPKATLPPFPESLVCINGLLSSNRDSRFMDRGKFAIRVDYRDNSYTTNLSRESNRFGRIILNEQDDRITERIKEIFNEHLSSSPLVNGKNGWKYLQRLIHDFPIPSYWDSIPKTILTHIGGKEKYLSFNELKTYKNLVIAMTYSEVWDLGQVKAEFDITELKGEFDKVTPLIFEKNTNYLAEEYKKTIFNNRAANRVKIVNGKYLLIEWTNDRQADLLWDNAELVDLPDSYKIAVVIHKATESVYECVLYNRQNLFVQWLLKLREACKVGISGLNKQHYSVLKSLVNDAVRWNKLEPLYNYLSAWNTQSELPIELILPEVDINPECFGLLSSRYRISRKVKTIPPSHI